MRRAIQGSLAARVLAVPLRPRAAIAASHAGAPGARGECARAAGRPRDGHYETCGRRAAAVVDHHENPGAADVKGHAIDVDTSNGIVTLTGRVENAEQKADAEQIARETHGVTRENNQLTVGASPAS
jgi:hypothetical protein